MSGSHIDKPDVHTKIPNAQRVLCFSGPGFLTVMGQHMQGNLYLRLETHA